MNIYRFVSGLLLLALMAQIIMTSSVIMMLRELGAENVGEFIVERVPMFTPASFIVFGIVVFSISTDIYNYVKNKQ